MTTSWPLTDTSKGYYPYNYGGLLEISGVLYGATLYGGSSGVGVAFKFTLATKAYSVLHNFAGGATDGAYPYAGLIVSGGKLYGTTYQGGLYNTGTVYQMDPATGAVTVLHSFHYGVLTDGGYPWGPVAAGPDGKLWGTTYYGGAAGNGTLYRVGTDGSGFGLVHSFTSSGGDGYYPYFNDLAVRGSAVYGTTYSGGTYNAGTIFKAVVSGTTTTYSQVASFDGNIGAYPYAGLSVAADGTLYGTSSQGGFYDYGTLFSVDATDTVSLLADFSGGDAYYPTAPPIKATDGNLYGTSYQGGLRGYGSLYSMAPDGTLTMLASFYTYPEGYSGRGGVVLGGDGALYGVARYGGSYDIGAFWRMDAAGTNFKVLHHFENGGALEGTGPMNLIQRASGAFAGTCEGGGLWGQGTIFQVDTSGSVTVLHHFRGAEGANPYGRLLEGPDGTLYGTCYSGGVRGYGTVWSLSPGGVLRILHDFDYTGDGAYPVGGLSFDASGNLVGANTQDGSFGGGVVYSLGTTGAGFAVLHNLFSGEGYSPQGEVLVAADGLYLTCPSGGYWGSGTILRVNPSGSGTVIHNFYGPTEGQSPYCALLQDASGVLYGTCYSYGPNGGGTVWKLDPIAGFSVLAKLNTATDATGTGMYPTAGLVQDAGGALYGGTTYYGSGNQANYGGSIFKVTP